jgi:membrane protease YdiL (CAAX protease family)
MISDKDRNFLIYWETVRERESSFKHKMLSGLPMALMFGLPILLFFGVVKIFFPAWFTTASHKQAEIPLPEWSAKFMKLSSGDIAATFVAVVIVILFFSYFRMQYKWEMNEQLYKELKSKEKKASGAAL